MCRQNTVHLVSPINAIPLSFYFIAPTAVRSIDSITDYIIIITVCVLLQLALLPLLFKARGTAAQRGMNCCRVLFSLKSTMLLQIN